MRCTEIRPHARRRRQGMLEWRTAPAHHEDPRLRMDALRCRAGVLQVDVLGRDLHIVQGGFDVGVPHQLHQCGQAHAGAHHVARRRCVGTGADWPTGHRWCGDDGGTGNVIPRVSCVVHERALSTRRTGLPSRDRAVPGADSDRAVAWFPAPVAASAACCPCRAPGAGLRITTRRRGSRP